MIKLPVYELHQRRGCVAVSESTKADMSVCVFEWTHKSEKENEPLLKKTNSPLLIPK